MNDRVRGRVMLRFLRAGGYAYIARAILANGWYVEAVFITPVRLEAVGALACQITPAFVEIAGQGPKYPCSYHHELPKAATSVVEPAFTYREMAQREARSLGVSVGFHLRDHGRWVVVVRTQRGDCELAHLPGEEWIDVLREAGLANRAKVAA